MPTTWRVYDTEGRTYGHYSSEEQARDAAASASRGWPWRVIRWERVA